MTKHEAPPFRMIIEGGKLVPATPYDAERLDSYRRGTKVNVRLTEEKDRVLVRKWWAVLGLIVKQCDVPWQNKEQASEAIKLALGIVSLTKTVGGAFMQYPKSLTELEDPELQEAVEQMMALVARITGVDPETLRKEIAHVGEDNSQSSDTPADDNGLCSVEGCERVVECRGLCGAHYKRLRVHGSPTGGRPTMSGDLRKFYEQVVLPYAGDDCLTWPYTCDPNGRASMYHEGKTTAVHRLACIAVHGEPPSPAHEAAHSCGNGHLGCVNPRHLRWATKVENEADKREHGTIMRGEKVPSAKLTEAQVREIIQLYGTKPAHEIGSMFGVSESTVRSIGLREKWAWVELENSEPAEEAEAEAGDIEAQEEPDASSASEPTRTRADCLKAFMTTATDPDLDVAGRRDLLEQMKEWWKADLPNDLDFVKACLSTADKVAKGELGADAARKYLEGLL